MIICNDCLKELPKIKENSIDFIITDPPYNLGKDFENDKTFEKRFNWGICLGSFITLRFFPSKFVFNFICRIETKSNNILYN